MIRHQKFSVTTDDQGDGTDTEGIFGWILAVHTDGADTAGADVTWSIPANAERGFLAETFLTLTDLGTGTSVDHPRKLGQDDASADLVSHYEPYLATGQVTMTVASGGDTKTYTGAIVYDDGR